MAASRPGSSASFLPEWAEWQWLTDAERERESRKRKKKNKALDTSETQDDDKKRISLDCQYEADRCKNQSDVLLQSALS